MPYKQPYLAILVVLGYKMTCVYILDNKDSKINRKMWARVATAALTPAETIITDLIIGKSSREKMECWMKELKPLDVVITDGNREGEDFIDSDFLACLDVVQPRSVHFVLLSADKERVENFHRQIEGRGPSHFTLLASLSNQLKHCLEDQILTKKISRKRPFAEVSDASGQNPKPLKIARSDTPEKVVREGMAAMLWNSMPVPLLPPVEEKPQAGQKQQEKNAPEPTSGVIVKTA